MDPWTQFLNIVAQVVTPTWNDLLQYMPLLLLGLLGLFVLRLAWVWQRNAALNRSRVPRVVTAGPAPAGVHLPGPSIWPFIVPIGGALMLLGLVLHPEGSVVNPLLLGAGLAVGIVGAIGWYRDAGREWRRAETGREAVGVAAIPARVEVRSPPPGVHLPGPSPWPFFAPIALFFIFGGLVFGPWLIAGGLVMGVIAAFGWYLDAGREYRQVEAGHPVEPRTRDPERAFPKQLVPIYLGVAGLTVFITLLPWLLTFLPSAASGGAGVGPGAATTTPTISASSAVSFDTSQVVVVAGQPITLTFNNKNAGVPHNVAIYDSSAHTRTLFTGQIVTGPGTATYSVPALPPGTYYFQCNIHPNMNGAWIAK